MSICTSGSFSLEQHYYIMLALCFGRTRVSNAMSIVELLVHMDCEGCEKRVRRVISKIEGVDSIEIDMDKQKVTVTGYVDQRRVLKVVRRKTGRKAEFWPHPYDNEYYPYVAQYFDDSTFSSTYNYYTHGYNESTHGYHPDPVYSTIIDDDMVEVFHVDNVHHACCIM